LFEAIGGYCEWVDDQRGEGWNWTGPWGCVKRTLTDPMDRNQAKGRERERKGKGHEGRSMSVLTGLAGNVCEMEEQNEERHG